MPDGTLITAPSALKMLECQQEKCRMMATQIWSLEGRLAEVRLCGYDWMRMLKKLAPLPWQD
jgi:hypothetical protein